MSISVLMWEFERAAKQDPVFLQQIGKRLRLICRSGFAKHVKENY